MRPIRRKHLAIRRLLHHFSFRGSGARRPYFNSFSNYGTSDSNGHHVRDATNSIVGSYFSVEFDDNWCAVDRIHSVVNVVLRNNHWNHATRRNSCDFVVPADSSCQSSHSHLRSSNCANEIGPQTWGCALTVSLRKAGVTFRDLRALTEFSGDFVSGSITAIAGGEGAGKSTLLRLLAGRIAPTEGEYDAPAKTDIGLLPSFGGVWNHLSVWENIEFVARTHAIPPELWKAHAQKMLKRAGLCHVKNLVAQQLSGGMRQKLGFVRATIHSLTLVLLDEPTTGVDPVSRTELWNLMTGAATGGAAVVCSTPYLDEVERAQQLYFLNEGSVVAHGTPDDVLACTPGVVWQARDMRSTVPPQMAEPTWVHGSDRYVWMREPSATPPSGFINADLDLEISAIAFLLNAALENNSFLPVAPFCESSPNDRAFDTLAKVESVTHQFGSFTALDGVSLEEKPER